MQGNSRKMASYMIAAPSKAASTQGQSSLSAGIKLKGQKNGQVPCFYCDMRYFCIIYTAALMCKWWFSAVAGYSGAQ